MMAVSDTGRRSAAVAESPRFLKKRYMSQTMALAAILNINMIMNSGDKEIMLIWETNRATPAPEAMPEERKKQGTKSVFQAVTALES